MYHDTKHKHFPCVIYSLMRKIGDSTYVMPTFVPSSPLWCVKHVDDTYTTKRGDYRMFFLRPGSRIAFVIG